MICEPCAIAADYCHEPAPLLATTRAMAVEAHERCRGCPCQHKVPTLDEFVARRAAMPRGGLRRIVTLLG